MNLLSTGSLLVATRPSSLRPSAIHWRTGVLLPVVMSALLWPVAAQAQPTSAPPGFTPIRPVFIVPPVVGPAVGADPKASSLMIRANAVQVVSLIEQVRGGSLSAQSLWQEGRLKSEDILWVLSTNQVLHYWKEHEVRHELMGVLVEHDAPAVADLKALSPLARWTLGEYYRTTGNEAAVAVFSTLLHNDLVSDPDAPHLTYQSFEQLAWFYRDSGRFDQAAATWMDCSQVANTQEWMVPDALIEAARMKVKAGKQEEAKALYDQIPQYGHGWITVLSFYDQALPLMDEGKLVEARALLSQPLGATSHQLEGQIAQNVWLASLDYREGKLEDALHHGEAVVKAGEGKTFQPGSTKNLYEMGRDIYLRAGGWRTQPIQCDVKEIVLKSNPSQPDQPLYARFRIKTYGDQSVTATVDNPATQVRVLPVANWQKSGLEAHEEEMEVIIEVPGHIVDGAQNQTFIVLLQTKTLELSLSSPSVFIKLRS